MGVVAGKHGKILQQECGKQSKKSITPNLKGTKAQRKVLEQIRCI